MTTDEMTTPTPDTSGHVTGGSSTAHSATQLLLEIAQSFETQEISLGDLIGALRDRAFGFVLLLLAIPCSVPFLYVIPQIVSVPLLFIAGQIVAGRHTPWLPEKLERRTVGKERLIDVLRRAKKYLGWVERFTQPRLTFLSRGPWERFFGALMVVFAFVILIPLPSTNAVPGMAIAVMSIGFIERDGLMLILGSILGTAWISFLVFAAFFLSNKGLEYLQQLFSLFG